MKNTIPAKSPERNSNIELLRIVLMIMIVLYHLVVHGYKMPYNLDEAEGLSKFYLYITMLSFTCMAVNCFVFISGYYGMKFNLKKFIAFVVQALFYSVILYVIYACFFDSGVVNFYNILKTIFFFTFKQWWFLNVYLALYVLSPIINKGLEFLNKYQHILVILILLYFEITYPVNQYNEIAGEGMSLYSFLTIYIMGRYCNKYVPTIKKAGLLYALAGVLLITTVSLIFWSGRPAFAFRMTAYSSIFAIGGAVLLFYAFKNIKMKNVALINNISPLVLAVYLIHDSSYIKKILYAFSYDLSAGPDNVLLTFTYFLLLAFSVFIVCIIIEKIRQIMFRPFMEWISIRIDRGKVMIKNRISPV